MEPDTDQDDAAAPEAAGEGWDEASAVPAGEEAPTPSPMVPPRTTRPAPTPEVNGKPRRKKPAPEILAKLPYFDQLYYQLGDEHPGASDAELKRMVLTIIAQQAPGPGAGPSKPVTRR
jgi:hypothetical protein